MQEKKNILLLVTCFSIAYLTRIIYISLQMLCILTPADLGEFWMVQLESLISVFTELIPLYYFVIQHIKNFNKNNDLQKSKSPMYPMGISHEGSVISHETVVVFGIDNISDGASSSKHNFRQKRTLGALGNTTTTDSFSLGDNQGHE